MGWASGCVVTYTHTPLQDYVMILEDDSNLIVIVNI